MIIRSLKCLDFRNYDSLSLDFSPGINVLYGDNAQGKTNILEAIYVCSTSRSHRGTKDREMIRFDQGESHIQMIVDKKDIPVRIDMHLKKGKSKGVAVDGFPIRKISELFGLVNVIFFSPEDLSIIKSSPGERRRFMDMELCQLDRFYTFHLVNYNKILVQRNKLLKDLEFQPELMDTLSVWDEQMVNYGKEIIKRRTVFVEELNKIIQNVHSRLTGGKEQLELCYVPNVEADQMKNVIESRRSRDIGAKISLTGPHRDDLECRINGVDVRRFGSQGQQRTAALSLKMAEIELVQKKTGDHPVLLLDDVFSELDTGRQNHLLNCIRGIQTILTCTGLDGFVRENVIINRKFRVENGEVFIEES